MIASPETVKSRRRPDPARPGKHTLAGDQTRQRMIDETSAFLTWALQEESRGRRFPRFPRRPVRDGGFTALLVHPAARTAVKAWWRRFFSDSN